MDPFICHSKEIDNISTNSTHAISKYIRSCSRCCSIAGFICASSRIHIGNRTCITCRVCVIIVPSQQTCSWLLKYHNSISASRYGQVFHKIFPYSTCFFVKFTHLLPLCRGVPAPAAEYSFSAGKGEKYRRGKHGAHRPGQTRPGRFSDGRLPSCAENRIMIG